MAARNKLFRKVKAKLAEAGEADAFAVARQAVANRVKLYYPGGQGGGSQMSHDCHNLLHFVTFR